MRSQPLRGEASRRRAEEQFKTTKKVNAETKVNTPRQVEAEKTARLRAQLPTSPERRSTVLRTLRRWASSSAVRHSMRDQRR
jgi:hypothetical protein